MPRKPGEKFIKERKDRASKQYNKARPVIHEFYKTKAWRKTSVAYRQEHPLCEECLRQGIITPAEMVHHVVEITDGGDPLDWDNLESLCLACHNRIHARDRVGGE